MKQQEAVYAALASSLAEFLGELPTRAVPILQDLAQAVVEGNDGAKKICVNQVSLLLQRAKTRTAKLPSYLLKEYGDDVARMLLIAILKAFSVPLP